MSIIVESRDWKEKVDGAEPGNQGTGITVYLINNSLKTCPASWSRPKMHFSRTTLLWVSCSLLVQQAQSLQVGAKIVVARGGRPESPPEKIIASAAFSAPPMVGLLLLSMGKGQQQRVSGGTSLSAKKQRERKGDAWKEQAVSEIVSEWPLGYNSPPAPQLSPDNFESFGEPRPPQRQISPGIQPDGSCVALRLGQRRSVSQREREAERSWEWFKVLWFRSGLSRAHPTHAASVKGVSGCVLLAAILHGQRDLPPRFCSCSPALRFKIRKSWVLYLKCAKIFLLYVCFSMIFSAMHVLVFSTAVIAGLQVCWPARPDLEA